MAKHVSLKKNKKKTKNKLRRSKKKNRTQQRKVETNIRQSEKRFVFSWKAFLGEMWHYFEKIPNENRKSGKYYTIMYFMFFSCGFTYGYLCVYEENSCRKISRNDNNVSRLLVRLMGVYRILYDDVPF